MEAFCCGNFDCQIIWKSKILEFEMIINSFGILYLSLKGGYVEFKDVARFTGSGRTLDSICKSFKLHPKYSKSSFPHYFMNKDRIHYVGSTPIS